MKKLLLIATTCLIASVATLRGQPAEAQTLATHLAVRGALLSGASSGTYALSTQVEQPNGSFQTINFAGTVPTGAIPAPQAVTLAVGRVYWLQVSTTRTQNVTIDANPPSGYEVHFLDSASAVYDNQTREYKLPTVDSEHGWDGHFGTVIGLCLMPEASDAASGQAGASTSLATTGAAFRIFMGSLPNGLSAGYLQISDRGRAAAGFTDAFNPDAVMYVPPSPEIVVHSPGGGERRIFGYEAGVWIQPLASPAVGYTIKFYHNSNVTDNGTTLGLSFSGSPYLTYTFEQNGSPTNLKITRTAVGATQTISKVATIQRTGNGWPNYSFTLSDWHTDGQSALVTVSTVLSSGTNTDDHNESVTLSSTAGGNSQTSSIQVAAKGFGEAPVQTQSGSSSPETATIGYYESDPNLLGAYGRPRLVTHNSGAWQAFEYYSATYSSGGGQAQFNNTGMVLRSHRPFKNTAAPSTTEDLSTRTSGVITTYGYQSDDYTAVNGRALRPNDELTTIDGTTVAHITTTYADGATLTYAGLTLPVVTAIRNEYADSSTPLTTTTKFIREFSVSTLPQSSGQYFATSAFWRKQVLSTQKPDGSKQVYAYQRGTYDGTTFTANTTSSPFDTTPGSSWFRTPRTASGNPSAASRIAVITGTASQSNASGPDNILYSNYLGFPVEPVYLVNGKSIMEVTIRDLSALVRRREKWIWMSGAFVLASYENLTYDSANNLVSKVASDGATYTATYDGGRKTSEADAAGITINYSYDDSGRVSAKTKAGIAGQADLKTDYIYDASGRTVSEDVHAVGGSEHLIASRTYDDAGRLATDSVPGHGTTTYSYAPSSNQVTVALPNGGTRIEISYPDGQKSSITGTGVVAQYFSYEIASGGTRHHTVAIGSSTSSRIQETWTDWLGRTTKTSRPTKVDTTYGSFLEVSSYSSTTGLLTKMARFDAASNRLYADTLYQYNVLGQLVRSGLDINSDGALTLASMDRVTDADESFTSDQSGYWLTKTTTTYPTANSSAAQVIETSNQRLSGFAGSVQAQTTVTDANGVTTDVQTEVNRATATTTVRTTQTGYANTQSAQSVNGLLVSVTGFDGLTTKTKYDSLQRPNETDDALDRPTVTTFISGTTLPYTVRDPSNTVVSTFGYDTAGRVVWVANAGGYLSRTEYDLLDHVVHQWGDGAFPVEYGYNGMGERTTMKTYRSGTGWNGATWPASPGTADTTTWNYDPAAGVLTSKADAAGRSVTYTYNSRGQTAVRTWARNVTTTYGYDGNTGELLTQTYSDNATPNIAYTYNRAGLVATVSDGTGMRTMIYNSGQALRLDAVDLDAFYGSRVLTRNHDSIYRAAGFKLGTISNLTADLNQLQTYNNLGRFDHLTTSSSAVASREFDYSYNGAGLVSTLSVGGTVFAATRLYETNRNLLTSLSTTWNGSARATYEYTYDAIGRRLTAKQSGSAFADFGGSTYYRYAYDSKNELTDATDYLGEDPSNTTAPQLSGRHHAFGYDTIGNRNSSSRTGTAGTPDTYVPNALNQYATRTNNYSHTAGTVGTSSIAVGVTGSNNAVVSSVGRQGRYWDAQVVLNNNAAPASSQLTVTATAAGAGSGGADLVRTDSSRKALIPGVSQAFTYDNDGNLTADGIWAYGYDAENRLVTMTTTSVAVTAGYPNVLLDFKYDYANRRVQKRTQNITAGMDVSRRYLYDGEDLVAEFNVTNGACGTVRRSFTWGLDLVGSLSAAGGVGALLQITDHASGTAYLPAYDGNGNVAALVNAATGSLAASYEYSPFGETLRAQVFDAIVADNPWRFSTKFSDDEAGLVYYGRRFYSPSLGRFINRDPIEEQGGVNLYGFALNDPIDKWDVLGNNTGGSDTRLNKLGVGNPERDNKFKEAFDQAIKDNKSVPEALGIALQASGSAMAVASVNGTTYTVGHAAPDSVVGRAAKQLGSNTLAMSSDGRGNSALRASGEGALARAWRWANTPFTPDSIGDRIARFVDPVTHARNFSMMFDCLENAVGYTGGRLLGPGADEGFRNVFFLGSLMVGAGEERAEAAFLARVESGLSRGSVTWTSRLSAGTGATDMFGNVRLSSLGTDIDRAQVALHEGVHSFLSPSAGGTVATLRGKFRMWAYRNSSLLRYSEEALAESVAQVGTRQMTGLGLRQAVAEGLRFPFNPAYEISGFRLGAEAAIGGSAAGGAIYYLKNRSE